MNERAFRSRASRNPTEKRDRRAMAGVANEQTHQEIGAFSIERVCRRLVKLGEQTAGYPDRHSTVGPYQSIRAGLDERIAG
jgi:hypothetical protein